MSSPRSAPSIWNVTPSTPTLSAAVAVSVTTPVTLAPWAGAVSVTVGGVRSGGGGSAVVKLQETAAMAVPSAALTAVVSRAV